MNIRINYNFFQYARQSFRKVSCDQFVHVIYSFFSLRKSKYCALYNKEICIKEKLQKKQKYSLWLKGANSTRNGRLGGFFSVRMNRSSKSEVEWMKVTFLFFEVLTSVDFFTIEVLNLAPFEIHHYLSNFFWLFSIFFLIK